MDATVGRENKHRYSTGTISGPKRMDRYEYERPRRDGDWQKYPQWAWTVYTQKCEVM